MKLLPFKMKLNIKCVSLNANRHNTVAALCWFSGKTPRNQPVLAICYKAGKIQIMVDENDEGNYLGVLHTLVCINLFVLFLWFSAPIIISTQMVVTDGKWNHDGSVLAICGSLIETSNNKELNQVNFYSPFGHLYRVLKVPGNEISSISWEGKSLRLAMAVDSFIYFANIRPHYLWCYFEKTVIFSSTKNNNNGNSVNVITFWNTISNQVKDSCVIKEHFDDY